MKIKDGDYQYRERNSQVIEQFAEKKKIQNENVYLYSLLLQGQKLESSLQETIIGERKYERMVGMEPETCIFNKIKPRNRGIIA